MYISCSWFRNMLSGFSLHSILKPVPEPEQSMPFNRKIFRCTHVTIRVLTYCTRAKNRSLYVHVACLHCSCCVPVIKFYFVLFTNQLWPVCQCTSLTLLISICVTCTIFVNGLYIINLIWWFEDGMFVY